MGRLLVAVGLAVAAVLGGASCGGGSSSAQQRHLTASLKYDRTSTHSIGGGQLVPTRAIDVIRGTLKAQARVRAAKARPFQKALATHFTRKGARAGAPDKLLIRARATGTHPLDAAFDDNVAAYAFDDTTGNFVDEQYVNTDTGDFDLAVTQDSPVSVWVGPYADGEATLVAPFSYGYDYEFPPGPDDVTWDYDAYFWTNGVAGVDGYAVANADQSGYYEIDWVNDDGSQGTGWFYLLPDDPTYGSYVWTWDDGTCTQNVQTYISFDATGSYWSVSGVDGPMSLSGQAEVGQESYLSGAGRWTITGADGLAYEATVAVTYLGAPPASACPTDALVVPPDPTVCPAGCSVDPSFGICVIDGTLDPASAVGLSCDLYADATIQTVINCPVGCTAADDGFCYDDLTSDICY
jgi:hypothetical protein